MTLYLLVVILLVGKYSVEVCSQTLTTNLMELAARGFAPSFEQYSERDYSEIVAELKSLASQYPDVLFVSSAQDLYGERPGVVLDADYFTCSDDALQKSVCESKDHANKSS